MQARSAPSGDRDYVPAAPQLWSYDLLCVLLSGARRWRPLLTRAVAPRAGERIGFENTEPNALGVLPEWMAELGFRAVARPT